MTSPYFYLRSKHKTRPDRLSGTPWLPGSDLDEGLEELEEELSELRMTSPYFPYFPYFLFYKRLDKPVKWC